MCWSGVDIAGDHLATLSVASAQECAAKCELPGDIPSDTAGGDCSLFVFDTSGRCILRRRPFSGATGQTGLNTAKSATCVRKEGYNACEWLKRGKRSAPL